MSIFLLVRFVTSVTKKKKSLFPQCDGCLAFQSHFKRLEWGTFLLLEREFDFNMYLFLPSKLRMPPLPRQGCSLPGTILKTSGVKKKKKIEGYTECLDAGDMCEVGSDTVSVASVRTKSCDGQELEDHGPERV